MMYCPKCNQECEGTYCSECGTMLIEKPSGLGGVSLNLGDANAISGGLHVSDSHEVHNTHHTSNTNIDNSSTIDNSYTVNTNTVYEAQKTQAQIQQDNENQFLQAVQERFADGILDPRELAELNQLAIKWSINTMRANQIIEQVRKSATILQGSQASEYLANQILQEVYQAIQSNQSEILTRRFRMLEQVALTSDDSNVQFYYHLLLASFYPEKCTVAFINSKTDNYWQLFWAHVAYVKLGNVDNGVVLLPRLGGFGCPQGDTALLMAIDNIAEYRKNGKQDYDRKQARFYLEQSSQVGMSEQLSGLWYAAMELLEDEPHPEECFKFYVEKTLKELGPVKTPEKPVSTAPRVPTPPPVPKFNAQNVNLAQMQGFNPLRAAQQMGLGMAGEIGQLNTGFQTRPGGMVPPPFPSSNIFAPPPVNDSLVNTGCMDDKVTDPE